MTLSTSALQVTDDFVDRFPDLAVAWQADSVPHPELVMFNRGLADELDVDPDWFESADGIAVLSGNSALPDSSPSAMAYAGHQFGGYSPLLGDGRALLLGEIAHPDGHAVDLHLKGSGRTPFARGGDGKATIGPMLREFLMAEAMHALGVPTTRALGVVTTGESIPRDDYEPGAVLSRISDSHIRVGTFEYAARHMDPTLIERLVDYVIERYYPEVAQAEDPIAQLLIAVVEEQAQLVAQWMLVGFIHGVMNTDNMLITGHTIDYGPCAFLDRYDPSAVFSSIDRAGRYAYGNQPTVAQWNLARLAETLIELIGDDIDDAAALATDIINSFPNRYRHHWIQGMSRKLALDPHEGDSGAVAELCDDLMTHMHEANADYTSTFRALATALRGDSDDIIALIGDQPFAQWSQRWNDLRGSTLDTSAANAMDAINPLYIPRNHLVEEALDAATNGDMAPFAELLDVVTEPYEGQSNLDRYAAPAPDSFTRDYQTFCGT